MKRTFGTLGLLAMATVACHHVPDEQELKRFTDIDVADSGIRVTLYTRKDLDEPAYDILVMPVNEPRFQQALKEAAGEWCLRSVNSGSGCSYKSKAGHSVFVSKLGLTNYIIYTSG
jgi:hypothetical protein